MNTITINITHAEAALLQTLLNDKADAIGALPLPTTREARLARDEQVERFAILAAKLAV